MSGLLQLYHRLPAFLWPIVAGVKGWQLNRLRYGADADRLVSTALEREAWGEEGWQRYQQSHLTALLRHAAQNVPFYREHWEERRRQGDQSPVDDLGNWPILEKEVLRAIPGQFVAEEARPGRMIVEHTSGTTGKPLELLVSKDALREWYALVEARWHGWYGVSRHDRWGIIGGQLVVPVSRRDPPFWVWNRPMRQLYLSAYHLAPDLMPAYFSAIRRHRLVYLYGYSSALFSLASFALAHDVEPPPLKVVITNAEPLLDHQRGAIEEAFDCPVRETYGMSEMVCAASECEAGSMHLWPEAGLVEVVADGRPLPPGVSGDLLCTGLLNKGMPLIRYRVGDRIALAPRSYSCPCKRRLPVLDHIEGRSDDVLHTTDGRQIGRLDPVFKGGLAVKEAQIIQESLQFVRVRYVPAEGFDLESERILIRRLQERLGPVNVKLEERSELPRGPNGKFRAVVSRVRFESERQVALPPSEHCE